MMLSYCAYTFLTQVTDKDKGHEEYEDKGYEDEAGTPGQIDDGAELLGQASISLEKEWAIASCLPVGAFGLLPVRPLALAATNPAVVSSRIRAQRPLQTRGKGKILPKVERRLAQRENPTITHRRSGRKTLLRTDSTCWSNQRHKGERPHSDRGRFRQRTI
jgi:hypothetical protein